MQTITKEYTVYKFNELSDSAKEKALESFYDLNVDHDWYEFSYEDFISQLNEVGLTCDKFYFELDRGSYIEPVNLRFTDVEKFVKSKIDENIKKRIIEVADLYITTACFSRHNKPIIETYSYTSEKHKRLNKAIDSLVEHANDALHRMLNDFLSQLQKEYDYLTSKEAIIETIEANDYDFLETGKLF